MTIKCTVKEFASIVRGCAKIKNQINCSGCPLNEVCTMNDDGVCSIEQFVTAADIEEEK